MHYQSTIITNDNTSRWLSEENPKELAIAILASYERGDTIDPEDDLANVMDFVSKMLIPLSDWETSYWTVHFDKKMEELCGTPGQDREGLMGAA